MKVRATLTLVMLLSLLSSLAFARVEFTTVDFNVQDFKGISDVEASCASPASASFWCHYLDASLTLIPSKGQDIFFNDAGEVVALYNKPQRGQDKRGNYNIKDGQNVIPSEATMPGGVVLIDGEYVQPQQVQSAWKALDDTHYQGTFSYELSLGSDTYTVEKTIVVAATSNTFTLEMTVTPSAATPAADAAEESTTTEASADPITISYAFPGFARSQNPIIKIGQENASTTNPLQNTSVSNPEYISFQQNPTRGPSLIVLPGLQEDTSVMSAVSLTGTRIALEKALTEDSLAFGARVYGGPNELVRYYQEGYYQLEGLFQPNIIGRLSLGVLRVLEFIHAYVGIWGLAIIVLTLLFRLMVWPLISTQTRSMVAMQQIQPKMKKLQEKHKDDRQKLNEEMMKLYQKEGVNPAMGCLPMIVQMPLFIILWRVFMNYEFNEGFLWVPDLGLPDPYYLMPALYIGLMFLQSYISAKGNPQSMQQMLIFNLVFAFIMVNFPAGVLLYWITNMLVQVGQHWLIQRSMQAPKSVKAKTV